MSKGKQPRTCVKVPKLLLSEIKDVFFKNNQEIGLEAAIFWRPRNRALIKLLGENTENLTDLNNIPKPCTHICVYICGVAEHWIILGKWNIFLRNILYIY